MQRIKTQLHLIYLITWGGGFFLSSLFLNPQLKAQLTLLAAAPPRGARD